MTARTVVTAVAFGLIAAGCAPIRDAAPGDCRGSGACKIVVTVVDCVASADKDPLNVYDGAHSIQWDLDTSGYTFADPGITFKNDPNHEFDPISAGPRKVIWNDKNSHASTDPYNYRINLLKDGTACPATDPGIINHG